MFLNDFPPIVSFLKKGRADALRDGGDFWGFFEIILGVGGIFLWFFLLERDSFVLYGVELGGEPYKTGFLTERGFYLISEVRASVIRGEPFKVPLFVF